MEMMRKMNGKIKKITKAICQRNKQIDEINDEKKLTYLKKDKKIMQNRLRLLLKGD